MPDEQCRICGNLLKKCLLCAACRGAVKWVCGMCGKKTEELHHDKCFL